MKQKEEITEVFDSLASEFSWEKLYSGQVDRVSYNFITRQRAVEELLQPYIAGKALDIGCGSGDLVAFYVKKVISYTGVDLSQHMIKRANLNYAKFVEKSKANFQVADCEKLPFKDREFDVLSAVALVEYLADPSKALDEIGRVIKTGGYALVTVPNKRCINNGIRFILKPVIDMLFPFYLKLNKSTLATMRKVKHYSYTQKEIDLLMENRGFKKIGDRYTNFHIIPHPLDHLIPKIYIKMSEKIDRKKLDKAFKNWASNYIGLYKKLK